MAKVSKKRLNDALSAIVQDVSTPVAFKPPSNNVTSFAHFMNMAASPTTDITDKRIQAIKTEETRKQQKDMDDRKSALTKTFEWMDSLGAGVRNNYADVIEGFKGGKSPLGILGDVGENNAAALGNFLNPVLEAVTPGFNHPFEEKLSDFYDAQNTRNNDKAPVRGSDLIDMAGLGDRLDGKTVLLPHTGGIKAPLKPVLGFGAEVVLDPLTYAGGLGIAKNSVKSATEAASAKAIQNAEKVARQTDEAPVSATPAASPPTSAGTPAPEVPQALRKPENSQVSDVLSEMRLASPPKVSYQGKSPKIDPDIQLRTSAAIDRIEKTGAIPQAFVSPALRDSPLAAAAIKVVDDYVPSMGKAAGEGIARGRTMNPINQTNVFNSIYKRVMDSILPLREGVTKSSRATPYKREVVKAQTLALQLMRTAEDHMISLGLPPVAFDGTSLRLTDVMAQLPRSAFEGNLNQVMDAFRHSDSSRIKDPVAAQAVADALAANRVKTSAISNGIFNGVSRQDDVVAGLLSRKRYVDWQKGKAPKAAEEAALAAGLTKAEAKAARSQVEQILASKNLDEMPIEDHLNALKRDIASDLAIGKIDLKVATGLNKAIAEIMEEAGQKVGVPTIISDKKVAKSVLDRLKYGLDTMGIRLTTWHGRGPMWAAAQDGYGSILQNTAARVQWLKNIIKDYEDVEINQAFRLAVDAFDLKTKPKPSLAEELTRTADPRVSQLADVFEDYFDNLIGSKSSWAKLGEDAYAVNGVQAVRMQPDMAEIDKALAAYNSPFSFKKYSKKGENWLQAINNIDPAKDLGQTVPQLIMDIDRAFSQVAVRNSLIDDFVMEFGRKVGSSGYDKFVHTSSIKNSRIPDDVKFDLKEAEAFSRLLRDLEKGPWTPQGKTLRAYFRGLRAWKTGVTIYNPSHHFRNAVGDAFLMWMAGHNNPKFFRQAQRMMGSERARYKEALNEPTLELLMGKINRSEFDRVTDDTSGILVNKYGADLSNYEIYWNANSRGMFPPAAQLEDLPAIEVFSQSTRDSFFKQAATRPLGGKAHEAASSVSEYREHFFRGAHYIAAVEKGITAPVAKALKAAGGDIAKRNEILKPIYDNAAAEVRKYHPDGRDLTHMEQSLGRGLIPFYAWTRKSIPLLIGSLMERPSNLAKISSYPRANAAMQQYMGIETESTSDQFPLDGIVPTWVMERGIGPIGFAQSDNPMSAFFGSLGRQQVDAQGNEHGYTVINPGNPFNDTISEYGGMGSFQDALSGILRGVTPAASIPFQLLGNQKTTGMPISEDQGGEGYIPFLLENTPALAPAQRMLSIGKEDKEGIENGFNTQALLNWATGFGIQGTGQYQKAANYQFQDYLRRQNGDK